MARENPTWGQEQIANELVLMLGLRVSPRTVRTYLPRRLDRGGAHRGSSQCWQTFIRNHAQAIVACDFYVVVTASFRLLLVFVVIEHATRRVLHVNVTAYPTADWTLQQLREAIPSDHAYRFLIHDRDAIFSQAVVYLYRAANDFGPILNYPHRGSQPVRSPRPRVFDSSKACPACLRAHSSNSASPSPTRPISTRFAPVATEVLDRATPRAGSRHGQ
jgi:hypothetical protein